MFLIPLIHTYTFSYVYKKTVLQYKLIVNNDSVTESQTKVVIKLSDPP